MLHASSRAFFNRLAGSSTIKQLASRYGMNQPGGFARRWVAGETLEEAIATARAVEQGGMMTTLNYLGERVQSAAAAQAATREYLAVLETVLAAGIGRNLSVKLTQLGLETDRAACIANLKQVLDAAERAQCFIRIDMEDSACTDATLDILEDVWRDGYRNVGVVLQSYLYRSESDVRRVNRLGSENQARQRGLHGAEGDCLPEEGRRRRQLCPVDARAADRERLPGDRDARSTPRAPSLPSADSRQTASSFSSSTASVVISRQPYGTWGRGCASTCPSAGSGSPISCAGWVSGRPTCSSS